MNETVDLVRDRLPKSYFTAAPKTVEIQRAIRYAILTSMLPCSRFPTPWTGSTSRTTTGNTSGTMPVATDPGSTRPPATLPPSTMPRTPRRAARLREPASRSPGQGRHRQRGHCRRRPTLSTPFAELSRVPANPGARIVVDLDHVYPYEDWFDHHVADRSFVTMVSFAPLATLNHGLDASNVEVTFSPKGGRRARSSGTKARRTRCLAPKRQALSKGMGLGISHGRPSIP